MRRTQQFNLYDAERGVETGRQFKSQAEIELWVQDVTETEWWLERHPDVWRVECPTVKRSTGEGSVGSYFEDTSSGVIEMHESHWNARCVLHELAHVCAAPLGSTSHDPIFARVYLDLVREFISFPAYDELRRRFNEYSIEVQPERRYA